MKSLLISAALLVFTQFGGFSYAAETAPANRQYPGGIDEQDLRVQTEMTNPTLKTDRRTFEQKIMQNIFKKNTSSNEGEAKTSSRKTAPKPPAKKN
ncbi:MAG: hypothetical protein AABZ31_05125 [Bdellovibrionota bacterium]